MNHRRHKDGSTVIAVGQEYSVADLRTRGFIPPDYPPFEDWTEEEFKRCLTFREEALKYDQENDGSGA